MERILQKLHYFENHHKHSTGIFYMILSQFLIVVAQTIIKQSTISVLMFVYHRALLIVCYVQISSKESICPPKYLKLLFLQGIFLGVSAPCFFTSVRMISLSEGLVINQLNTIWSQFMAFFFLHEILSKKRIRNILLSLFGLILITRPTFIFNNQDSQHNSEQHFFGCLIGLVASVTVATSYTIVKLIGKEVKSSIKVFYVHFGMLLICGFFQIYESTNEAINIEYIYQLVIATFLTYISHYIFQYAITLDSYASLAPYSYINIIFSLFVDILVFQIIPQSLSILGGGIIVISMILNAKNI